jgi:endonuclease YncB( thermonuclease family)
MAWKEKVTRVIDGDTFETNRRKKPVRLANVDTPEKREKGYQEAKKALKALIESEYVTVTKKAHDKYGRTVANVRKGRKSVNKHMKAYEKK